MDISKTKAKKINFPVRVLTLVSLIIILAGVLILEKFAGMSNKVILITMISEIIGLIYFTWELTDGLD